MESSPNPVQWISAIIQRRAEMSRATKKGHFAQSASAEEGVGVQIADRRGASQTRRGRRWGACVPALEGGGCVSMKLGCVRDSYLS